MLYANLVFSILKLILGVAIFLFAIKIFSSSLKNHFGAKIKPLFEKVGNNRFAALGIGAGATALMQSSTATTVMTVGLVNVGVLTLFQSTAIIMGANVGTTLTSVLAAFSSLQIKYLLMSLSFIGFFIYINFKDKKLLGSLFIGLGGIFIGLELLSLSFSNSTILQGFFSGLFARVSFPLALIALGAVFTAVIQSSSASTVIYMSMLANGLLSFNSAVFLILGSEIGTCLTTLIASSKATTSAKRAAFVHLLFNLLSAIIFTAIMWPFGSIITLWYTNLVTTAAWQLSIFQVFYNVASVLILIWFIKPLNKLVSFVIREKRVQTNLCKRNSLQL